jgi:hypothetical protein
VKRKNQQQAIEAGVKAVVAGAYAGGGGGALQMMSNAAASSCFFWSGFKRTECMLRLEEHGFECLHVSTTAQR